MKLSIDDIQKVVSSFSDDDPIRSSHFESLYSKIYLLNYKNNSYSKLISPINLCIEALWNIETVIYRIYWSNQYFLNESDNNYWNIFSQSDIRAFHMEYRSLLDYVGLFIKHIIPSENKPKDSFHALFNNAKKYQDKGIIDKSLYDLIISCEWFNDFKSVRDKIVHNGARVMTFIQNKNQPIMCSILDNYLLSIIDKDFFINNNKVFNFERYVAYHMVKLYVFLDDIANWANNTLMLNPQNTNAIQRHHPGLPVLKKWICDLEKFVGDFEK